MDIEESVKILIPFNTLKCVAEVVSQTTLEQRAEQELISEVADLNRNLSDRWECTGVSVKKITAFWNVSERTWAVITKNNDILCIYTVRLR